MLTVDENMRGSRQVHECNMSGVHTSTMHISTHILINLISCLCKLNCVIMIAYYMFIA